MESFLNSENKSSRFQPKLWRYWSKRSNDHVLPNKEENPDFAPLKEKCPGVDILLASSSISIDNNPVIRSFH